MTDGFENTPTTFASRWTTTGAWAQDGLHLNGNYSASDTPVGNYTLEQRHQSPFGRRDEPRGRTGCVLDYFFNLDTRDLPRLLQGRGVDEHGRAVDGPGGGGWSGSTGPVFMFDTVDMGAFEGLSPFLRLRLTSDADGNVGDGVHVEDLDLRCLTAPPPLGEYQNLNGTSMATPHVAGVAALLLARNPHMSPAQVKSLILSNVDPIGGLAGKVATGGRLNARSALDDVDVTKPNTTITSGPKAQTTSKTAKFKFKSTEAGSTFKCKLDKGAFKACASGKTYKNLKKGKHTFQVIAVGLVRQRRRDGRQEDLESHEVGRTWQCRGDDSPLYSR